MPSRYHDIQALLGTSFTLGFGDIHTTFTVVRNEETQQLMLQLDTGLNTGAMPIRTTYKAISDDELCNLKTTREWLDALETSVRGYVNEKVADITGGTSGGNVMLLPVSINVNDVTEATYNITMGTLARDKFIDRVIFEVLTPFSKADGSTLEFSVGTDENPELLVPKTNISSLQSTLVVDICKTITADTTIKVFGYMTTEEPEEPDDPYDKEFVQRVDNNHESVSVSMTSDANDDVINITLSGDNLTGSVLDSETFGEVTGDYMDFAVNIPLKATGVSRYRIVQTNPALAYYDGKDEYVSNDDGVWTKDRTYEFGEEEEELLLSFLMTQSAGADDYAHIWVYDLDSETPDVAFRTYHIKNELNFAAVTTMTLSDAVLHIGTNSNEGTYQNGLGYEYWSAYESNIGVVEDEIRENRWTVYLTGTAHDCIDELGHLVAGATLPGTMVSFLYEGPIPNKGIKVIVRDPYFEHTKDDADSSVEELNGVYYGTMVIYPETGVDAILIAVPIGNDQPYHPMATVVDQSTNQVVWQVEVVSTLKIVRDVTEEEVVLTNMRNLPASSSVMPMAAGDTGVMRVRILSF